MTEQSTIGIKELAAELGTQPGKLRAFIRANHLSPVGRGKRYTWDSLNAEGAKAIMAAWKTSQKDA